MKLELGEKYSGYLYSRNGFLFLQQIFSLPIVEGYSNTPIYKFAVEAQVLMSDGFKYLVRLRNKSSDVNLDCYEHMMDANILTFYDSKDNPILAFSDKFENLIPIISENTIQIVYGLQNQINYYQRQLLKLRENRDVVSDNKNLS